MHSTVQQSYILCYENWQTDIPHLLLILIWLYRYIYIYILSVYSPFSDRVGLPLHNIHIPSPFTSIMDIFFVDLEFDHIALNSVTTQ